MEKLMVLFLVMLYGFEAAEAGSSRKTQLLKDFYKGSCPLAEDIIREETWKAVKVNPAMAAKLLRLHYHDCFVRGCDASILIDSIGSKQAEKDAGINFFVTGYNVIDNIKEALEHRCPGIVSCADILALVARDAVSFQSQTPLWEVLTGRRDGRTGFQCNRSGTWISLSLLQNHHIGEIFRKKRLITEGSCRTFSLNHAGAHTIGVAPCSAFSARLTGEPTMNSTYAASLRKVCRGNAFTTVSLDPQSSISFDNHYYVAVKQHKGLMESDAALLQSAESKKIMDQLLNRKGKFVEEFGKSMRRMGSIRVLTGKEGRIRKNCRVIV